ncbi:phosphoserine phosphatase SerB [Roseibium sp. RKSG952]|uniref:phosphoserine phosphatase SerB n=1 Tax=Roseibium sp. RKSG952 TaxID=2529384 RepID=UPI0012BB6817|nr:phosphoserine phosphatase SerB [Roseibium sp. RKSG952]MTH96730.1 phosphoserine phosphatase SerB [Roseibium sp. RKSG952]
MSLVATLVSNPAKPAVSAELIASAASRLPLTADPVVLAEDIAADFAFDGMQPETARQALIDLIDGEPVDVFVQPQLGRKRKLLIADMDSTMIRQECIDELAAELGLKDRISEITERAMQGEIAFDPALRERVALLEGLPVSSVETVLSTRIQLMPGGRTLVQTMKENGAYCALVSGGFTHFTQAVAALLGFDENQANTLLEQDGKLTGQVSEPVLGRDAKRQRLAELMDERDLSAAETIAVGDGANDLAMIELAGAGIAYRAKPAVAAAADYRVDHGDLTALLYFQGYRQSEFSLS